MCMCTYTHTHTPVTMRLFMLLMVLFAAHVAASTCSPANYNKQVVIYQGEGATKCHNEFGGDAACVTTCLICYTNCRGINDAATFIVGGEGTTTCLCSGALASAPLAATTTALLVVATLFF